MRYVILHSWVEGKCYINVNHITSFHASKDVNGTFIRLLNGDSLAVKETVDEVQSKINLFVTV